MNEKKLNSFFIKRFGPTWGFVLSECTKSILTALWFMLFTLPLVVVKVNTINRTITWRWNYVVFLGIATFILSFMWRYFIRKRDARAGSERRQINLALFHDPKYMYPSMGIIFVIFAVFPFVGSLYQVTVLSTALIYVMLGVGLNVVVGLGGMLNLGYVAFYAVGAYTYALLNVNFGLGFWISLPIAALISTLFGLILSLPVLRLRGDYLAIVTLAFGEITRLVLENFGVLTQGPSGIRSIARPGFLGMHLKLQQASIYMYLIILGMTVLTLFIVYRLENSRIGRAWQALREDEIASKAMGINISMTKLTSFALGATWAGFAGVLFAAKTTFINPASFTLWESIVILCFVVLGGMGSILGVTVAALILTVLPESLRAFSELRMLVYGVVLVLMMIFRPGGIVDMKKKHYNFNNNVQTKEA